MPGDGGWQGRLVLLPGALLYVGRGGRAARHAHHAVQVVWALDGAIQLELPGGCVEADGAVVPAQTPHAFDARGALVVMLLVERHAAAGVALEKKVHEGRDHAVAAELAALGAPDAGATVEALAAWSARAIERLAGTPPIWQPLSRPIRRIVAAIEAGTVGDLTAASDLARLSKTRATHRFTAEVGLPFRRFVLWSRLKRAVLAVRDGADLTRAAMDAGFSDAAHFSRTFRDTIGLAPSRVLPFLEIAGDAWALGRSPPS